MIRITFASGVIREYEADWEKLSPGLQMKGLKLWRVDNDTLIPTNSNTMALIERFGEEEFEEIADAEVVEVEEVPDEEEKKESIEEKKEKLLAEMKAKSECKHDNVLIYYQEVKTGPRNKQVIAKRYFPVCAFCGLRMKNIKTASLTEEERANAKLWDK